MGTATFSKKQGRKAPTKLIKMFYSGGLEAVVVENRVEAFEGKGD